MTPIEGSTVVLEMRDVSVRFGAHHVLRDVNLVARAGRVTGLIGPNGAGKTTLFNAISGLVKVTSGEILLDGEDLVRHRPWSRPQLGLFRTFQHGQLVGTLTVEDNLMGCEGFTGARTTIAEFLGTGRARGELRRRRERARACAERLGVSAWLDRPASELSTGNAKLVDLGRAIVNEPRVLILDEPAVGLSPAARDRLASILTYATDRGAAVLVIEHNMGFLTSIADDMYALDLGCVIAHGAPQSVQRHPEVLRAYLGAPTPVGSAG